MAKIATYIMVMAGLVLLFHFTGLTNECGEDGLCTLTSPTSILLNMALSPEEISLSNLLGDLSFISKIAASLAGVAIGVAILAGLYQRPDIAIFAGIVALLVTFGADFLSVFNRLREVNPYIAILVFGPIMILYMLTVIEWWRGMGQ